MKRLWILNFVNKDYREADDTAQGYIVRATTPEEARKLAHEQSLVGCLGYGKSYGHPTWSANYWLDPAVTCCDELTTEGESEVVMVDFLHG